MSVLGLPAAELDRLERGTRAALADALSVHVGEPAPDRPAVLGTHAIDAEGLRFLPRLPFVPGVGYTARFTAADGTLLEHRFEVGAAQGRRPTVVGVFPSGEALPENALRLYVRFSQPMDARDAHRRVHLLDEAGSDVPLAFVEIAHGLWDPGQTRLTLLFHPGRVKRGIAPGERLGPPLRAGRTYRLTVDAAMTDAAGRPLAEAFARPFTVSAPDRESPRAEHIRVGPPRGLRTPVVVDLPEPLDEALLERLVWVEDESGVRVEGKVEVGSGETRWSFEPAGGWSPGRYAVRVHPALEDRAGNRFDRVFDREAPASSEAAMETIRLPFRVASTGAVLEKAPAP
ncbi:MAG TPA: Ig-like domain-containing protein [Vicinamibacteria bacterium]|nr:Ig-like domain-containing protein [Vicinamibacteria bacterium]